MKKSYVPTMTAMVLGLAVASSAVAQQQDFPNERTSAKSCAEVNWNKDMLLRHPSLIDACQEVISVEGETWARFAAKFVRVESNGDVTFSVRDQRDRSIEEVTLDPTPGQVAYMNGRSTPFSELRTTDSISLYVPEGQYGFATQPGAPREQLATVVVPADSTTSSAAAPVATTDRTDTGRTDTDRTDTDRTDTDRTDTDRTVAQRDTRRAVLPTTAGFLPWLALVGFLSMLGGLGLTLRRWN